MPRKKFDPVAHAAKYAAGIPGPAELEAIGKRLREMGDRVRAGRENPFLLLLQNTRLGLEFYDLVERQLAAKPATPRRERALKQLESLRRTSRELVSWLEKCLPYRGRPQGEA